MNKTNALATSKVEFNDSKYKKTQKKKNKISSAEKSKLWDLYDENCTKRNEAKNDNLEDGLCNLCENVLIITEDGFPTCSNPSCGIIYTNTLDYSPEWRYYGSEDKNANDPTRCGNPINPLLIEYYTS